MRYLWMALALIGMQVELRAQGADQDALLKLVAAAVNPDAEGESQHRPDDRGGDVGSPAGGQDAQPSSQAALRLLAVRHSLPTRDFRVGHIPGSLGGWREVAGAVIIPVVVPILGVGDGKSECGDGQAD
mgnify:CR=1 FL=1